MINLGLALTKELELESTDTLGRWMAHYISGLIRAVEESPPDELLDRQDRCAKAILDLWDHRRALPNGKRPFEDLEPVIATLEALNPETPSRFYHRGILSPGDGPEAEGHPSRTWLKAVEGIDYSARVLMEYCLSAAARVAEDKSEEWVRLAEAAGRADDSDVRMVRVVFATLEDGDDAHPNKALIEALEARLKRLEGFAAIAETIRRDLQSRLDLFLAPSDDE